MQWILQDIPLGKNIRRIRKERQMTQMEVASKMQLRGSNMSCSSFANIESGRRNIRASGLKCLRIVLEVGYDEFFRD